MYSLRLTVNKLNVPYNAQKYAYPLVKLFLALTDAQRDDLRCDCVFRVTCSLTLQRYDLCYDGER